MWHFSGSSVTSNFAEGAGKSLLLVGNLPASRGGGAVLGDLATRLAQRGWRVFATSHRRSRPLRLLDMLGTAWRLRKCYAVAHVDVFSGPAFVWAEAVSLLLRRLGKPYVLTLHGGGLPGFARRWPGRVRRMLRPAPAVTAPSRYLVEQMAPYRADIRLIPNAIEVGRYRFRPRCTPKPNITWLRAFHRIYNPELAPRVLHSLSADCPEANLSMVGPDKGDGSRRRTLDLAARLGVAERVRLLDGVPKAYVPSVLDEADVFLNTTNVDNTPVSVIEAMACGLCIVSTNVGGIPYLLDHERDALLVPPDDAEAMAAAVRRILREPGLAARLSENARRKAERFDWSIVLPQWEQLLLEVAERGKS